MMMMKLYRLVLSLVLIGICFAGFAAGQEKRKSVRVLFIGNSLTYSNSMPKMFAEIYMKTLKDKLEVEVLAEPNFGLEDHWTKGKAVKLLQREKWDFVVMQQGPSASAEGRESLLKFAREFQPAIKAAGARGVIYMVWPSVQRAKDMDGVVASYSAAAAEIDSILAPAGCAWVDALNADKKIKLFAEDGFHPTAAGSYLAALSLVKAIAGTVADKLPTSIRLGPEELVEISDADLKVFAAAVKSSSERCVPRKQ